MSEKKRTSEIVFLKRIYQLPPSRIAFLRFLLESYDGLLFLRTLDRRRALVEISFAPSRRGDAEALLAALAGECAMVAVVAPSTEPSPPF